MEIFNILFTSFWYFLPAGIANAAPIAATKLPVLKNLNYPLDFNIKIGSRRLLGHHKTIRGVIIGILFGTLTMYFLKYLFINSDFLQKIITINYRQIDSLTLGFLLSFGALFGDTLKSFFKRLKNIAPGEMWIPFDQIDWLIGAMVFSVFYIKLDLYIYLFAFPIFIILHVASNAIAYVIKLKDRPY